MEDDPDSYLGWAAAEAARNRIVYAYTLAAYRTPAPDKRQGFEPRVATTLLGMLGIDFSRSVAVTYWTDVVEVLSKRPGYKLERA
jgi:hypothetical protein